MNIIGEMNRDDGNGGAWRAAGMEMTRNGAEFTWTGNIYDYGNRRDFRLSPSNADNWDKTWIIPPDRTSDAPRVWIQNSNIGSVFSTTRIDTAPAGDYNWYIENPGNGNYTIVYNAIDKTVSVTKN
jgi:hypothetical protein